MKVTDKEKRNLNPSKRVKYHDGHILCQHCGLSQKECKKCFKQIGEYCCKECEMERRGIK